MGKKIYNTEKPEDIEYLKAHDELEDFIKAKTGSISSDLLRPKYQRRVSIKSISNDEEFFKRVLTDLSEE